jgi:hypothetical protein
LEADLVPDDFVPGELELVALETTELAAGLLALAERGDTAGGDTASGVADVPALGNAPSRGAGLAVSAGATMWIDDSCTGCSNEAATTPDGGFALTPVLASFAEASTDFVAGTDDVADGADAAEAFVGSSNLVGLKYADGAAAAANCVFLSCVMLLLCGTDRPRGRAPDPAGGTVSPGAVPDVEPGGVYIVSGVTGTVTDGGAPL